MRYRPEEMSWGQLSSKECIKYMNKEKRHLENPKVGEGSLVTFCCMFYEQYSVASFRYVQSKA